ncbi:MAG: SRPBCC family protein [Methylococcaceae bacterium]|nr:SRPBCC family protein [Methylococcaceae bacterium]
MNRTDPVTAEASTVIDREQAQVFDFIAGHFHENYPRWMTDVIELECLDPVPVKIGTRVRQVRVENNEEITSTFEIKEIEAFDTFSFQGIDMPYRQIYRIDPVNQGKSHLTFRFELLEVDLFMRPFVKLIRSAMIEGVEGTLVTLSSLLNPPETSKS